MAGVVFYVVAHQDDWQLFRGHSAFADVRSGAKVVFICVTAGDGGLGSLDYANQRERGMINSCRLATDDKVDEVVLDAAPFDINDHRMGRFEYKNTTCYFLRIRDGGNAPKGPLESLRAGGVHTPMVGDATPYASWGELVTTLQAILEQEQGIEQHPWVNALDKDSRPPAGKDALRDNPDHIMVGLAVSELSNILPEFQYVYFWGYPIGAEAPVFSLDSPQVQQKRRLFAAYLSGGSDLVKDYVNASDIYESWLPRSHPV